MTKDLDLIESVQKNDCDKSLKELIARYSALCHEIYRRFSPSFCQTGVDIQSIYAEKDYVIWKAAKAFKKSRGYQFSTMVGNYARYQCLSLLTDRKKQQCFTLRNDVPGLIITDDSLTENQYLALKNKVCDILSKEPDKRLKKVFELRHLHPKQYKWKQISEIMGLSVYWCITLEKRARKIVKASIL